MNMKKEALICAVAIALSVSAGFVFAASVPSASLSFITGNVTATNGSLLTVLQKLKSVSYSVDAQDAKVSKGGQKINISDIKVGDTVRVIGKIDGTNISSTTINVIVSPKPAVVGSVTSVNNGNFTMGTNLTGADGKKISYTVDVQNSTTFKNKGQTASLSDVSAGEKIVVFGAIDKSSQTISADNVNIMGTPNAQANTTARNSTQVGDFASEVSTTIVSTFGYMGKFLGHFLTK